MEEREEGAPEELSPEEILERAKKENEKNGDERERGKIQWCNYAGYVAIALSCVVVMIVLTVINGKAPTAVMAILFTGIAAQNIVQACVNKQKKTKTVFIVCAVLITAGTAVYWVLWILGLCGVAL